MSMASRREVSRRALFPRQEPALAPPERAHKTGREQLIGLVLVPGERGYRLLHVMPDGIYVVGARSGIEQGAEVRSAA
jgi:hypothetical protein